MRMNSFLVKIELILSINNKRLVKIKDKDIKTHVVKRFIGSEPIIDLYVLDEIINSECKTKIESDNQDNIFAL